MGDISTTGRAAFRDFQADGIPSSGLNEPVKSEVRTFVDATQAGVDEAAAAAAEVAADLLVTSNTLGALGVRVDTLEDTQASGVITYKTYAELAARTDLPDGSTAFVSGADASTHTDPVVGGTVANVGAYRYSESPAGWERTGDTNDAALAVLKDAVGNQSRIYMFRPICVEPTVLKVPFFLYVSPAGVSTNVTPADSLIFTEVAYSEGSGDVGWRLWLDINDNTLHAETATSSAPTGGNENLLLLVTSYKGQVVGHNGAIVATTLPNENAFGRERIEDQPFLGTTYAAADITDSELIALGFTRGWENSFSKEPVLRAKLLTPRRGGWLYVRGYIQSTIEGDFGTPYATALDKDETVSTLTGMVQEASFNGDLAAAFAIWLDLTGKECDTIQFGPNVTPTGDVIVTGLQMAWSPRREIYVAIDDYPLPDEEIGARLRNLEAVAPPDKDPDILYPEVMWGIANVPISFYPENLVPYDALGGQAFSIDSRSSSSGALIYERHQASAGNMEIDPARCGATINMRASPSIGARTKARKTVTLTTASLSSFTGKSPKILMIGDSLVKSVGLVPELYEALVALGATPTFLGTINGVNGYEGGVTPRPCEGRAGNTFATYTYAETTLLVPADTAAYNALTDTQRASYNPFLVAAGGGEDANAPAYIRNGFKFDFGNYLTRFSYADPDIVFVNFMHNDIVLAADLATAIADVEEGIEIIASRIRLDVAAAKIVFTFQTTGYSGGLIGKWFEDAAVIRAAMQKVADLGDAEVYVLPVWAHQSRFVVWGTETETTAATESTPQLVRSDDDIHFREASMRQAAETHLRFIANHI